MHGEEGQAGRQGGEVGDERTRARGGGEANTASRILKLCRLFALLT